jgi:hypothetical protein
MSEADGTIHQYRELVDDHLERYHRTVEETDAAEVISYMSLLIYQHLEARGYIETFRALPCQDTATIADEARRVVERELLASVYPSKAHLILLVVFSGLREVDWLAVAEVILDETADERMKARHQSDLNPFSM